MALKAFDGFDHYGTSGDILTRGPNFIQYEGTNAGFNLVTGRNGNGKAAAFGFTCTFGQRVASAFVGHAIYCNGSSHSFVDSVSGLTQVTVVFNQSNYSIQVYRGGTGGTLLYYSANNVWAELTYNYVEIWPTIDPTAGSVQVRVNGQILVNLTGVNTQASSNAWWDKYTIGGPNFTFNCDDLYYADTTIGPGSYPCNTPLGDVRVFTAFPIGNSSVAWSPQPNTNTNWQNVDQIVPDDDTTYNFTTSAGAEDLLNFSALANTVNKILGVQVTGRYRKDDATMRTVKQAVKSGVSESYGTTQSLPDNNYVYYTDLWTLDPATAASWTLTGVNGIAAGYNLVS